MANEGDQVMASGPSVTQRAEVTVLYKSLPHYRVDFFEQLRSRLAAENVHLRLVVGRALEGDRSKRDEGELAWAEVVGSHEFFVRHRSVLWQPVLRSNQAENGSVLS